jgi:hypothetical protein
MPHVFPRAPTLPLEADIQEVTAGQSIASDPVTEPSKRLSKSLLKWHWLKQKGQCCSHADF